MEVELYEVQTKQGNIGTYIPFTGELKDGKHYNPSDCSHDMMQRVADMVCLRPFFFPTILGLTDPSFLNAM